MGFLLLLFSPLWSDWECRQLKTRNPLYYSQCLYYPSDGSSHGIELSFIQDSCGVRAFVSVFSLQIPPYEESTDQAVVTLCIAGESFTDLARMLEGGQKLILPEVTTQKLINAFCAGEEVSIYLNGYEAHIAAGSFPKLWKQWNW